AESEPEPPSDRPKVPEKYSPLGIKMPTSTPEVVTIEGIHIYGKYQDLIRRITKVVRKFPRLWIEKDTPIDVPEEDQMRIPLVEGWQTQLKPARSYPLSQKDRAVLDSTFGALHNLKRMGWNNRPTPFTHPIFVVWRKVNGVEKGRVVIDMRQLNRVTVPDAYPLPLQSDIVGELRGKKYITAIDAASFFYQFRVYPPHQDRFTLVSPRGL
ncbi:hypothetical protein QBC35DRAFT_342398, partial [Podospora australis]